MFYKLGYQTALEKLGQGYWEGLAGPTRGLIKRLGAGALGGGVIGGTGAAMTGPSDEEGGSSASRILGGALLGSGLGAGAMYGVGRLARRGLENRAKRAIGEVTKDMSDIRAPIEAKRWSDAFTPELARAEEKIIPRYSPEVKQNIVEQFKREGVDY